MKFPPLTFEAAIDRLLRAPVLPPKAKLPRGPVKRKSPKKRPR
jgi:hypothetical protein